MRRFLKKIEDIFAAVAFAEAGEHKNALDILKGQENERYKIQKNFRKKMHDPVFAANNFAVRSHCKLSNNNN